MAGVPEPAWKTHEDGQDAGVRQRLEGCAALGPGILSLDELKKSCKEQADAGADPSATVELGLFLTEDEYEQLKAYARTLNVSRPKVRRKKS